MKLVTSYALANQVCLLFDRSLNTYLCEIYDHKAAFLLIKTVIRNSSAYMEKAYGYYRVRFYHRRVSGSK